MVRDKFLSVVATGCCQCPRGSATAESFYDRPRPDGLGPAKTSTVPQSGHIPPYPVLIRALGGLFLLAYACGISDLTEAGMRWLQAGRRQGLDTSTPAAASWLQVPALNPGPAVDAAGESHYQDALEMVGGGRTPFGVHHPLITVTLVREPANPYDSNAVRIDADGRPPGPPAPCVPARHGRTAPGCATVPLAGCWPTRPGWSLRRWRTTCCVGSPRSGSAAAARSWPRPCGVACSPCPVG